MTSINGGVSTAPLGLKSGVVTCGTPHDREVGDSQVPHYCREGGAGGIGIASARNGSGLSRPGNQRWPSCGGEFGAVGDRYHDGERCRVAYPPCVVPWQAATIRVAGLGVGTRRGPA